MTERRDVVSVVAGGWSFSKVPHEHVPGYVIAVNDSALHLRVRPSEVVSMDRLWTEHRWGEVCRLQIPTYLRRSAVQNLHNLPEHVCVFDCDHMSVKMTDDPAHINGTNSGVCGIGRAYQVVRHDGGTVFLFGFDMQDGPNGERHWFPPYPWAEGRGTSRGKFVEWNAGFKLIRQQFADVGVRMVNVSDRTLITCIPRYSPDWLWARQKAREERRSAH